MATDRFYAPDLPTAVRPFSVLLLRVDLLHGKPIAFCAFFRRNIRQRNFMGNAFGRQQSRQFSTGIPRLYPSHCLTSVDLLRGVHMNTV